MEAGGAINMYTAGSTDNWDDVELPLGYLVFSTVSGGLFHGSIFLVAEVFDNNGARAGLSVGVVNPAPA